MSKKSKAEQRAARAAAAAAERRRRERRRNLLTALGVVVVMALIVGGGLLVNSLRDDERDAAASDTSAASDSADYQLTIGPDDAPHSIVFYEDFLCPICKAVEDATRDDFARLAEEGKVQVSYRPFNLFSREDDPRKPYSVLATAMFGAVLESSGDEVAKEFHDLLFDRQPSEAGPFPGQDDLVALAIEAGADEEALTAALEDGAGEDWVDGATNAAQGLGINSTPTIYLDGREFQDYRTLDELSANLVAAVD